MITATTTFYQRTYIHREEPHRHEKNRRNGSGDCASVSYTHIYRGKVRVE